jgi:atypical dual specificity phosphatase
VRKLRREDARRGGCAARAAPEGRRVVSWIVPGVLAGGARPRGDEDWRELRQAGVAAVLCLTEQPPPAREGIEVVHLPIRDFSPPTPDDVERAVAAIDRFRAEGCAVLVHCGAGLGRTGTILACYLVSQGREADEAIAEVRTARPGSIETHEQEESVRRFARTLRGA